MKNNNKEISNVEYVLRILGGIILIMLGITIFILHAMKVVPAGWETSPVISAFSLIWVWTGPFIGAMIITYGLYLIYVFDYIVKWAQKKGGL